jgi:excisionase family DNA binding protein
MSETSFAHGKLAYRVDEAVKASGLGRTFLYEHMASGELPSVKIGRRRLILHHELMNFLSQTSGPKVKAHSPIETNPPKRSRSSDSRDAVLRGQLEFSWGGPDTF